MQILGLPKLETFKDKHADARGPLDAWRAYVERQSWKSPQDIKRQFASADFLAGNRVIFNIKGMGQLIFQGITRNDVPIVQGVTITVAIAFIFINMIVDMLYVMVNPRIRSV